MREIGRGEREGRRGVRRRLWRIGDEMDEIDERRERGEEEVRGG